MELKYALTIYSSIIMSDGVSPTKTLRFHLNEDLGLFDIAHHAQVYALHLIGCVISVSKHNLVHS